MIEKSFINKTEYDSDLHKVIFKLNEEQESDNIFCMLKSDYGNIAVSYHENNLPMNYYLYNGILFMSYGKSCVVLNLTKKIILYHEIGATSLIYEILSIPSEKKVLMIGEITIKCFSSEGKLIYNQDCKEIIIDWEILENYVKISYYDDSIELIKI